jgi:hypothetical protein
MTAIPWHACEDLHDPTKGQAAQVAEQSNGLNDQKYPPSRALAPHNCSAWRWQAVQTRLQDACYAGLYRTAEENKSAHRGQVTGYWHHCSGLTVCANGRTGTRRKVIGYTKARGMTIERQPPQQETSCCSGFLYVFVLEIGQQIDQSWGSESFACAQKRAASGLAWGNEYWSRGGFH